MTANVTSAPKPLGSYTLAATYSRIGWIGFWVQVVFGSLPAILMVYYFFFSRTNTGLRAGLNFVEYMALVNLALVAFTTVWSFRYTRLAQKIADPGRRPTIVSLVSIVWTGIVVSGLSMLFSMVVMLIESASLLFYFLKAPQGGMPVIQTSGAESVHWVSSVDMISLVALNLLLFAELIVLLGGLWLLYKTGANSPEYPSTNR